MGIRDRLGRNKDVEERAPEPKIDDTGKRKRRTFEDYIKTMFPPEDFDVAHNGSNGFSDIVSSGIKNPDFIVTDKRQGTNFAIVCEYRPELTYDHEEEREVYDWAKWYQIKRYVDHQEKEDCPTYVVLGLGGRAHKPENVYCLSLEETNCFENLHEEYLQRYEREEKKEPFKYVRGKLH